MISESYKVFVHPLQGRRRPSRGDKHSSGLLMFMIKSTTMEDHRDFIGSVHPQPVSDAAVNCVFPIFFFSRSSLTFSTRSSDQTSPRGLSHLHREKIESPGQEEQKMSILLLIQLGKSSV